MGTVYRRMAKEDEPRTIHTPRTQFGRIPVDRIHHAISGKVKTKTNLSNPSDNPYNFNISSILPYFSLLVTKDLGTNFTELSKSRTNLRQNLLCSLARITIVQLQTTWGIKDLNETPHSLYIKCFVYKLNKNHLHVCCTIKYENIGFH